MTAIDPDAVVSFEGRCWLERCPGRTAAGHWNNEVTFTLKSNRQRTDWWYESSCAPGVRQPSTRYHWRADVLDRMKKHAETQAVIDAFDSFERIRHGQLPLEVEA